MNARIRLLTLLLLTLLTGCGIRVEVVEPIAPTPTPPVFPGVTYDIWGVGRQQATPAITFVDTRAAQVQLFMQKAQADVYLVQYRQLLLSVDYNATWYASPQSNARTRLNVYTRHGPQSAWTTYGSDEVELVTTTVPMTTEDSLVVGVYVEDTEPFEVRAEVTVIAYSAEGDVVSVVDTNNFNVIVLTDPGEISTDTSGVWPAAGELEPTALLLDWRSWSGGPCSVLDWLSEDDERRPALGLACDALNAGDVTGAAVALDEAAALFDDELSASLHELSGLLAYTQADYEASAAAFTRSSEGFRSAGRVVEMAISLHNVLCAHALRGDEPNAVAALILLQELRGQIYDEVGNVLTDAIIGFVSSDRGKLEAARDYLAERELPQADIISIWLNQLPNNE